MLFQKIDSYKYSNDYCYFVEAKEQLINTNIKLNYDSTQFDLEYYFSTDNIEELKYNTGYVDGYTNLYQGLDPNSYDFISKKEWNAKSLYVYKPSYFVELADYDAFTYNSSKGCYEYTKEHSGIEINGIAIITGKTVSEVYFRNNKLSKIVKYEYTNEALSNVFGNPSDAPVFVLDKEVITEFYNYGKTKVNLPNEVKALIK